MGSRSPDKKSRSPLKNTSATGTQEADVTRNKTITIQDLSVMKAKSYQHTSQLHKKKYYHCELCDFKVALFQALKNHLKAKHLENETDNTNVLSQSMEPKK